MSLDRRFVKAAKRQGESGVQNMCEWLDQVQKKSHDEGLSEGLAEGKAEGEKKLSKLIQQLLSLGRTDDVAKAVSDEDARKAFYREFGMND